MRRDYKLRHAAAVGAMGFAAGIFWASRKARDTSFGKLSLGGHDAAPRSLGEELRHQLPPMAASPTTPAKMIEPLEPLTPDVLKRRIVEVFPDGYLTIIAIIQGVALGVAIVATQQQMLDHRGIINRLVVGAQALAVFMAIVIITHRYLILTIDDRWAPTILDTLIPYALGVGEITTALVIGGNVTWWIAVSVLFLAAAGTYAHTYIRTPHELSQGSDAKSIRIRMIYCFVTLGYSAIVAGLAANNCIPEWLDILLPFGTVIGGVAVAVNGEHAQNKLYDAYGIPRWHRRLSYTGSCRSNCGKSLKKPKLSGGRTFRSTNSTSRPCTCLGPDTRCRMDGVTHRCPRCSPKRKSACAASGVTSK